MGYAAMPAIFDFLNAQGSLESLGVPLDENVTECGTPTSSTGSPGSAAVEAETSDFKGLLQAHFHPVIIDEISAPLGRSGRLKRLTNWFKAARSCRKSHVEPFTAPNYMPTRC